MEILREDIEVSFLTGLFCSNQRSFYLYIAKYAASDNDQTEKDGKPLRVHRIDNLIDCIFSPNHFLSFYNAILNPDICNTIKEHHYSNADHIIKEILTLASNYKCPIRSLVKPTAIDTQDLLKRHGFMEWSSGNDSFLYIDFYDQKHLWKSPKLDSSIQIYELDDSTQIDCQTRKSEWGYLLLRNFGVEKIKIYGPFYSNVWSQVEVGPTKPVRMFIALINDQIVGGCQISCSSGVTSLFNLTTLKEHRGKGIGKALSFTAMMSAKEQNYRYMLLQSSPMGLPIYQKLGFQSMPSYKLFLKLSTAAWYFKIIEILLNIIGIQRIIKWANTLRKVSKSLLLILIIGVFLAVILK